MAKLTISGEDKFKALKNQFMVGPSAEGYTLAYSATGNDGEWTSYSEATPANENLIVNGAMQYGYFKLVGNQSEVDIIL